MSFLSNVKARNAAVSTKVTEPQPEVKKEEPTSEPIAHKKPLLVKKNPLLAKKNQNATVTENEEKKETVLKKNPFKLPQKQTEDKAEDKAEVKAEEKTDVTKEVEKKEEVTEVKEKAAETKVANDTQNETEETSETKTEEPKKATKKRSRKKNDNTDEAIEDTDSTDTNAELNITKTTISYQQALEGIKSTFEDEDWENLKESVNDALNDIVISEDMNPATLKQAVADLSKVRQMIQNEFSYYKNQYEALASEKPEGLIQRIRTIAFTKDDKNDMDRRKTGVLACMNYKTPQGDVVNLYEILDETRERYYFIKEKIDSIEYKSRALITMNGALKLDEKLQ